MSGNDENRAHRYKWWSDIPNGEKAFQLADSFREELEGNVDYGNGNIVVLLDGTRVEVIEYMESDTYVKVDVQNGKMPELRIR